jgi:hypothetical protein
VRGGLDRAPAGLAQLAGGHADDWRLWADWFERAAASTCFAPPDGRPPPPVDAVAAARIERCRQHYDVLRASRLRA